MYAVPASKRSIKQDVFQYTIGEQKFTVVSAKFLTGFQLEDVVSGDLSAIYDIFGKRGTKAGDAVRGLDQQQMADLISSWIADSDVTPGESAAS